MNLREAFPSLTHQDLCDALTEEFRDREGASGPVEEISEQSELAQAKAFQDLMAELGDKSWRFGKTPEFSHQFETRIDGVGVFDVHLKVVHGVIEDATIFSDALFPDVISAAMTSLCGVEYGRDGIGAALKGLGPQFTEEGPKKTLEAMTDWMISNVGD
ncbi:Lipoate-protein ligase A (Lipoate--protein ligase) [Durusdinium trenchii]